MSITLPPPQPRYVLRGHAAQVHALEFSSTNKFLLSADAEGYAVVWSLASKRAIASWRAHKKAILGVAWWSDEVVVTHGRDDSLHMWKIGARHNTVLPVDLHANPDLPAGKIPVLFHTMTVNTLNFCAFKWINYEVPGDQGLSFLLALPHTLSSEAIDIFHVRLTGMDLDNPHVNAIRKTTIPPPALDKLKTGLTMCLAFHNDWSLLAGYESGHTFVYTRQRSLEIEAETKDDQSISRGRCLISWEYSPSYISRPHSQPVLSIQSTKYHELYLTTAADSKLASHQIPILEPGVTILNIVETEPLDVLNTKHSGQQGLSIRDDGLLIATAGWDGRGRVYRAPSEKRTGDETELIKPKEIAVLKWHNEGAYCTSFAHVKEDSEAAQSLNGTMTGKGDGSTNQSQIIHTGSQQIETSAQRRDRKAKDTHWLALGSKDGKISLWDIL